MVNDDFQIKKLLEENLELAKENNGMLKRLRNAQRWATLYRIFYIVFMIGIVYGGYYLVQPYIKSLINTYDQTVSGYQKIKDLEANFGANIQDIVK
jgi:hypothetical protein